MRQFRGHTDRITDLQMSQDARWLLSSSLDGTMRVWDVPSARCLQVSLARGIIPRLNFQRSCFHASGSLQLPWCLLGCACSGLNDNHVFSKRCLL